MKPGQGAAHTEEGGSIRLMPSPLGNGSRPAGSITLEHDRVEGKGTQTEAAVPTASDTVQDHLDKGDCTTAVKYIFTVIVGTVTNTASHYDL